MHQKDSGVRMGGIVGPDNIHQLPAADGRVFHSIRILSENGDGRSQKQKRDE
jgi:hypothetical protein